MVTVGYGDNVPIASNEKIYVIFMACISGIIYAYLINSIN